MNTDTRTPAYTAVNPADMPAGVVFIVRAAAKGQIVEQAETDDGTYVGNQWRPTYLRTIDRSERTPQYRYYRSTGR